LSPRRLHPCVLARITQLRRPSELPQGHVHRARSKLSSSQITTPHSSPYTMRWLQLLTASLLPFTALAAKKSSGDRFKDARAKSLSIGHPLKVDDGGYAALTKGPRDYSVVVLLTAQEARFGCKLCNEFQPEWDVLGKSWVKGDKDAATRLVFATLDFVDGKNTFQSVCTT
jgi:hypothetical protein